MKYLLALTAVVCLTGCNWWNRDVDIKVVKQQLEQRRGDVAQLKAAAATLAEMAEKTGEQSIIDAAVAARGAFEEADAYIPKLESELDRLEKRGGAKVWELGLAALWPLATSLLKLIPGPGGMAANLIAEVAYRLNATRTARKKDEEAHALLASKVETTKVTK